MAILDQLLDLRKAYVKSYQETGRASDLARIKDLDEEIEELHFKASEAQG